MYNTVKSKRGKIEKLSYSYQRLLKGYIEWLEIIGYAASTVKSLPTQLVPFLHYLKESGITNLGLVPPSMIDKYYEQLKTRKSNQTGELLKSTTLNTHIRNLYLFNDYLEETEQGYLPINLPYESRDYDRRPILSLRCLHRNKRRTQRAINIKPVLRLWIKK